MRTVVTVKISELKDRLRHYLRLVQRGERVMVCDRARVVACIEPPNGSVIENKDALLDGLERAGVVRRPTARLAARWVSERVRVNADLVAAVLADRREGFDVLGV